jgi:hypothetical protein
VFCGFDVQEPPNSASSESSAPFTTLSMGFNPASKPCLDPSNSKTAPFCHCKSRPLLARSCSFSVRSYSISVRYALTSSERSACECRAVRLEEGLSKMFQFDIVPSCNSTVEVKAGGNTSLSTVVVPLRSWDSAVIAFIPPIASTLEAQRSIIVY